MSAKPSAPADPAATTVIRDVVPGITTFSVPFLQFNAVKFGGRATAVRLATGSVAVFSPVALTDVVKEKIASLGTVKYIIAPDAEHHIHLSTWAAAYPDALIIGPEGLPEKREQNEKTKGTKFATVFTAKDKLTTHISEEFDAEFAYEFVNSHENRELPFFHKPTRTLIEADLIFNLPATEAYSKSGEDATSGLLNKVLGGVLSTKGGAAWQRRFLWHTLGGKDRKGLAESAKRINEWDFDRIIPCHGDVIETGGKAVFESVYRDYLALQ